MQALFLSLPQEQLASLRLEAGARCICQQIGLPCQQPAKMVTVTLHELCMAVKDSISALQSAAIEAGIVQQSPPSDRSCLLFQQTCLSWTSDWGS